MDGKVSVILSVGKTNNCNRSYFEVAGCVEVPSRILGEGLFHMVLQEFNIMVPGFCLLDWLQGTDPMVAGCTSSLHLQVLVYDIRRILEFTNRQIMLLPWPRICHIPLRKARVCFCLSFLKIVFYFYVFENN